MKSLIATLTALVLISVLVVTLFINSRDYEHFTSSTEPQSAPVPLEVSDVAWEWNAPEGTSVLEVAPGTAGPILLTEHGAVALDGSTGEEIWGFTTTAPDTFDTLAGVTPAGDQTVIFQVRRVDDGAVNQVTVLDSATGNIDQKFKYEIEGDAYLRAGSLTDPAPDPRALSEHTWPEPTENGLRARSLEDGQIAWEYTPAAGCSIRSQPYGVNLAPYTIASTADLYLFPEHCDTGQEDQENDETSVESTGQIVALNASTGEATWPAITDVLFNMRRGSQDQGFRTHFTLDTEQTSILVQTPSGDRIFDLETGQPREDAFGSLSEDDYTYSDLTFLDSERLTLITGYPAFVGAMHLGRMELSGDQIEEQVVVDGYDLFPMPGFQSLRTVDAGMPVLSLDNGVLVNGCERKCGTSGYEDQAVIALFAPWNGDGVEHAIELPGFDPTLTNWEGRFMAVPGSIVTWQTHGERGLTRTLVGLA